MKKLLLLSVLLLSMSTYADSPWGDDNPGQGHENGNGGNGNHNGWENQDEDDEPSAPIPMGWLILGGVVALSMGLYYNYRAVKKAPLAIESIDTIDQLRNIMPLKATVTKEILSPETDRWNPEACVGAKTLQSVLPPNGDESWGWRWQVTTGIQRLKDGTEVLIGTKENVAMTELEKPQEVTFIIKQVY